MAHTILMIRTAFGEGAAEHRDTLANLERALDSDPNVLEFEFRDMHFNPDHQVHPNTPLDDLPGWNDEGVVILTSPTALAEFDESQPRPHTASRMNPTDALEG